MTATHGLLTRAELLLEQGALEAARQVLREAFALQPEHGGAKVLLARVHAATGARRLAMGVLEEVIAQEPAHLPAILLLATLCAEEGQWREARHWLDQGGSLAPGDSRVAQVRAALLQQSALQKLRGEDIFDRPSVAERLEEAGRFGAAREIWERLAQQYPAEGAIPERLKVLAEREEESLEGEVSPLRDPPSEKAVLRLRKLLG